VAEVTVTAIQQLMALIGLPHSNIYQDFDLFIYAFHQRYCLLCYNFARLILLCVYPSFILIHISPRNPKYFWIIIGSDRRPETRQGVEGKIVGFRSGWVQDRVRDRVRVMDKDRQSEPDR